MPIDIALIKHLLDLLVELDGRPLSGEVIASELDIRTGRMLTTAQVQTALGQCRQSGWADKRLDDFKREVWWITETGKSKQQSFVS